MNLSERVQRFAVSAISAANSGVVERLRCPNSRIPLFGLKAAISEPMSPSHIGCLAAAALDARSEAARINATLQIFVANSARGTLDPFETRTLTSPSRLVLCAAGSGAKKALAKIADAEGRWKEHEFDHDGNPCATNSCCG